jgi:hypothetical protein
MYAYLPLTYSMYISNGIARAYHKSFLFVTFFKLKILNFLTVNRIPVFRTIFMLLVCKKFKLTYSVFSTYVTDKSFLFR